MKRGKLKLKDLEVQSFVTSTESEQIKGGDERNPYTMDGIVCKATKDWEVPQTICTK